MQKRKMIVNWREFILITLLLTNVSTAAATDFFISPEEAEQLQLSEREWNSPIIKTRGAASGPTITVKKPTLTDSSNPTLETGSPLNLTMIFEQRNAPVDMATLEIIAKKGFFSKSLTDRVRPYISGTTLEAKELKVPNGKFKIQIKIADIKGSQTSAEYRLIVQ